MKSIQLTMWIGGASFVLALTGCPKHNVSLVPDAGDSEASERSHAGRGEPPSVRGGSGGGGGGASGSAGTCDLEDGGVADMPVLHANTIMLWPPNHKLHDITVEDCVDARDACGQKLTGEFIWASCDEPEDDIGDGHKSPDIVLSDDCQQISVRAERQGPSDGRVYKLGVRVFGADGSSAEAQCRVIVAHDQGKGEGVDSGEAYHLTFDGTNGQAACGMPPEMPSSPPPPPPPPSESSGQPLPS